MDIDTVKAFGLSMNQLLVIDSERNYCMIFDQIIFHNVAELNHVQGHTGHRLQRVPENVRSQLSEKGQRVMLSPVANVELRFLLISESVEITLSASKDSSLQMHVCWSDFSQRGYTVISGKETTVKIERPSRYRRLDHDTYLLPRFDKRLVRIMFSGDAETELNYHGISEGDIETPSSDDVPNKTVLSYGTSITHGAKLFSPQFTYPFQMAYHLGMDYINLGMSGTAYCEPAIADYIAERKDWDIATLALSVNMYNDCDCIGTFYERVKYMVNSIAGKNPSKPVYCITLYPFFDDVGVYNADSKMQHQEFRQTLRDVVKELGLKNTHILEGPDLLTDFTLLTPDLIHPSEMGMVQIGENLAAEIIRKGDIR